MKKMLALLVTTAMCITSTTTSVFAVPTSEEMRGVWVASVYNIDFPSAGNKGNVSAQKAEIDLKMAQYKKAGLNTVFLQVRPKSDALYNSALNPWSDVLTGEAGKHPGYDPLEYAIKAAHENGLELHAWLNPYRVTTSGVDLNALPDGNFAKANPSWVISYNKALYLNPEIEGVQNFISETAKEIVLNYNVDGIHFDDYFYPTNYPLTNGDGDGEEANKRRENVNTLVRKVNSAIDSTGKGVAFGISPIGIYKNVEGSFKGSQSYYSVFADTVAWINNGWVDYVIPQVYWETNHATAGYENVVKWWNEQVNGTQVKLYIGEGIYKDAVAKEIGTHLDICKKYSNISGNVYYSSKDLLANRQGSLDAIKKAYATSTAEPPAQLPEPLPEQPSTGATVEKVQALPTNSNVMVDGDEVAFEAYNIDGFNYFKLRDIAFAITGSEKQFNTAWDESMQAINLEMGTPYKVAGGELAQSNGTKVKIATTSVAKLYLNGAVINCQAYNIDGSNYYKLRDVGKATNFGVTWSEDRNMIGIVTPANYQD